MVRYGGAANIKAKQANFIPVVIHNLNGYDSHLFLEELSLRKNPEVQFRLIPKTN